MVKPANAKLYITLALSLSVPSQAWSLADNNTQAPCSFIVTGEVSGDVKFDCQNIPTTIIEELIANSKEHRSTIANQQDLITFLKKQVEKLEADRKKALSENSKDLKNNPKNPLLEAERDALQKYDMRFAAQLREKYYRQLKAKQLNKITMIKKELAREAYIAGERWESANSLAKALPLFQEAVEIFPPYFKAWRKVTVIANKLGNTQLALASSRQLQIQASTTSDPWWIMTALNDEADSLVKLGQNKIAFAKYKQALSTAKKNVVAEPQNTEWQRDLSVSHNKVGDMHKANGDNGSALKAYQEALAIRKHLAELDPKHTEWQRDLSVSHNKVGDMHKANGDNGSALKAYQEGLNIAKHLAELDPNIVEWQTDLVVSYFKLSRIQMSDAPTLLKEALIILERLQSENRLDYEKQAWIKIIKGML